MKKIVCVMTALCLVLGITACSGKDGASSGADSEKAAANVSADENGRYEIEDVSYVVMAETESGDMRITETKETEGNYQVVLIDAANTGDSSGAMTVTMTKEQYDKQIKGKKTVICDARKTVFLVPCKEADQKKYQAPAFEYTFVKTSLDTEDSNKDYMVKEMANIVLKELNSGDEAVKASHLCTADFDTYKNAFAPVE